ncbi:TetR/AcrR family transcriptional regulator [Pseudooceanicola sp. CBS1P-1]|uniref:TetR family transcriptional regulator n=1 Tax=Pseudooceanicola albus TaxID=2692189 RepID=A0A6L7G466_9RHOB|nr:MULTISPECIES: TetR/AcrR family transcriptional regulator [Pseudooceanicola]MBT9385058.1 TetR/AcrR family transcriptional regulator [Pseudooceanicola endophyticus]MXN18649.1 TetR family transcriptional regulator [Pseudooceanicola albus]
MRKPRADAQKNREKLIDAAREVLGGGGPEASLEAVARRAGVGIGTLYRHFPNREVLFHAVFRQDLEGLVEQAEALEPGEAPLEAVRGWLHANVALVETKRGMLGALSVVMSEESKQTYAELTGRVVRALNRLLAAGVARGQIREGIAAEDLLQTMYAFCYAREPGPEWRAHVLRLLDIFIDGLRRA